MRNYYDINIRLMDTDVLLNDQGQLDGIFFGEDQKSPIDLTKVEGSCDVVCASIEDNGESGDGLWLSFAPSYAHEEFFLSIRLRPEQARILGQALICAADMRRAEMDCDACKSKEGK